MPFWPSLPNAAPPMAAPPWSAAAIISSAVQTGIGPITVKVPKVRAKNGTPVTFCSALVLPYVRNAKSIEAALPWLYLKGISTGEMGAALTVLMDQEATGFCAKTISSLKVRGLTILKRATGDGAMGFWAALEEVFPTTRQQRCWVHKTGYVLNDPPKRTQPKAKKMLHDIWQAETREDAHAAFDLFVDTFEPKYPKAAECLIKDREELLTFYDFPAQHWQSIRTSNPIESAFATIRHRTKRTKGCLSRDGMLHTPLIVLLCKTIAGRWMFKLSQCAEKSWRKLRGFAHLADVIQGVDFINGIKPSNQDQAAA